MPQYTCTLCGTPVSKRGRCTNCKPSGRANRSPTTRAQDPEYTRERTRLLAPDANGQRPACQLRIRCDGAPATTVDHQVPVAHGGKHAGNLVPACGPCNYSRQARVG